MSSRLVHWIHDLRDIVENLFAHFFPKFGGLSLNVSAVDTPGREVHICRRGMVAVQKPWICVHHSMVLPTVCHRRRASVHLCHSV